MYMDMKTETTVTIFFSSEINNFAEKSIKHWRCTNTRQCKQVLYVQVAPRHVAPLTKLNSALTKEVLVTGK